MNDSEIHHLSAAYALDALDLDERAHFEAHYHDCEICVTDVVDFRAALAELAIAHHEAPPAGLKADVMAKIAATRQLSPRVAARQSSARTRPWSGRGRQFAMLSTAIAASTVLAVGGGFVAGRSDSNPYNVAAADLLARDDTRVLNLAGEGEGRFRVTWSPSANKAIVTADDLAAPGDGQAYELWLIDETGPHPLGLLDDASNGDIRRVIDVADDGSQLGVTVEQDEGSPTPTGPILFAGSL
jgi:anti-sigma-K factor RskA